LNGQQKTCQKALLSSLTLFSLEKRDTAPSNDKAVVSFARSTLLQAASEGNLAEVKRLIKGGASVKEAMMMAGQVTICGWRRASCCGAVVIERGRCFD
jgi:hypothetical protein